MSRRPAPRPRKRARLSPRKVERLWQEAVDLERQGDRGAAKQRYRLIVDAVPAHPGALHALAMLEHASGDLAAAIDLLQRAVRALPDEPSLRNNLGNLLRESGLDAQAVSHYRAALRSDPGHPSARFNLASALTRLGQIEDAATELHALLERRPSDAGAWTALGNVRLDLGQADAALEAQERAVALAPGSADAHNNLGLVHMDLGRFDAAAARFRRALELDPDMAVAAANLARSGRFDATETEDLARIEAMLARLPTDDPRRIDLHFALGKIHDDGARYAEAFAQYRAGNRLAGVALVYDRDGAHARTDRLIAAFDADRMRHAPTPTPCTHGPVLIVGMPRSGTTLVEQILASHPAVQAGGERPDLDRIVAALAGTPSTADSYPECIRDLSAADFLAIGQRYLAGLEGFSGDGIRWITDKMPSNFQHLGLVAMALPGARIVHCRRDPLDVCLSIYFRQFTHEQAYAYAADLADIAHQYREYRRLMAHWDRVLPGRVHTVDYEAVVDDQEATTRALLAACGLPWAVQCLDFHRTQRSVHTASNWQVRQPLYDRSRGRWRHYAEHLDTLQAALGDAAEPAPSRRT